MRPKEKIKSLSEIFDEMDGFVIKSEMTEEDYKEVIKKVTYMLALAYDKGFADGQKVFMNQDHEDYEVRGFSEDDPFTRKMKAMETNGCENCGGQGVSPNDPGNGDLLCEVCLGNGNV